MRFPFNLPNRRLALIRTWLIANAALVLACDRTDLVSPPPLPGPLAQVSSHPVAAVTASGWQDPNIPENAVDNDLGTRWSAQGDGQWIQYDLGALEGVGRVDIAWYQALPDTWDSAFDIAVSSDGVIWNTVFSGRSTAGDLQHQGYGFPTVTCRYVRIIGHGQWDGATLSSWWNSITEVDIYDVLPVTAVDASGHQDPNVPGNTLDNDLGTRWSAQGDGQWIQYDLGAPQDIGGVDIVWYQYPPNPPYTWESAFDIDVSSDAAVWTTVFSGRSVAGNVQYQRFEFPTVTGRYVRIVGHGQWNGATFSSWWNSMTEVDIHPGSLAGACSSLGPQPGPTATIILQDGFESGTLDLDKWTLEQDVGRYSVASDSVRCGSYSLKVRFDPTNASGPPLSHWFMPGYDDVYVRFYVMFQDSFQNQRPDGWGMHFLTVCGNNISNPKSCWGQPGIVPDGTDYFYAGVDPEEVDLPTLQPLSFYTYWPDMTCCFGNPRYQTPPKIPLVGGQWQEVVLRVRMNTPGQYDGSQELWIDGQQKIVQSNMRWRTTTALHVNNLRFDNWMGSGSPQLQYLWIDDVTVWRP